MEAHLDDADPFGITADHDQYLRRGVRTAPERVHKVRCLLAGELAEQPVVAFALLAEVQQAAGQRPLGPLGRGHDDGDRAGPQPRAPLYEGQLRQALELFAQLVRNGDDQGLEGDHGLGAELHGRVPGDLGVADHLHRALSTLVHGVHSSDV
ncbi:hypothetical protein ACFY0A_42735 [Streptomyces sp. NPDC001698]|uniref:hypothetical protein n=1 Tax=Streptomyces sp. NPDC001698 TaxID=3364601 RepID=UPI0036AE6132